MGCWCHSEYLRSLRMAASNFAATPSYHPTLPRPMPPPGALLSTRHCCQKPEVGPRGHYGGYRQPKSRGSGFQRRWWLVDQGLPARWRQQLWLNHTLPGEQHCRWLADEGAGLSALHLQPAAQMERHAWSAMRPRSSTGCTLPILRLLQKTLANYYAPKTPGFFDDAYILGVRCSWCCGPLGSTLRRTISWPVDGPCSDAMLPWLCRRAVQPL